MSTAADPSDGAGLSLHENAEKILMYLRTQENERASTTALRNATGLSAANISGHHALTLVEKGLIEKVGTEVGDAPKDTNVYELTHRGRKEANDLLKQNEAPMSEEDQVRTIRELQKEVRELKGDSEGTSGPSVDENRLDAIDDRLDEHEERLDELRSDIKKVIRKMSKVADKVSDLKQTVK